MVTSVRVCVQSVNPNSSRSLVYGAQSNGGMDRVILLLMTRAI
jgi:hypothetical protein